MVEYHFIVRVVAKDNFFIGAPRLYFLVVKEVRETGHEWVLVFDL
jgi:hypothetical protein